MYSPATSQPNLFAIDCRGIAAITSPALCSPALNRGISEDSFPVSELSLPASDTDNQRSRLARVQNRDGLWRSGGCRTQRLDVPPLILYGEHRPHYAQPHISTRPVRRMKCRHACVHVRLEGKTITRLIDRRAHTPDTCYKDHLPHAICMPEEPTGHHSEVWKGLPTSSMRWPPSNSPRLNTDAGWLHMRAGSLRRCLVADWCKVADDDFVGLEELPANVRHTERGLHVHHPRGWA